MLYFLPGFTVVPESPRIKCCANDHRAVVVLPNGMPTGHCMACAEWNRTGWQVLICFARLLALCLGIILIIKSRQEQCSFRMQPVPQGGITTEAKKQAGQRKLLDGSLLVLGSRRCMNLLGIARHSS